jgi:hypothetical protein
MFCSMQSHVCIGRFSKKFHVNHIVKHHKHNVVHAHVPSGADPPYGVEGPWQPPTKEKIPPNAH